MTTQGTMQHMTISIQRAPDGELDVHGLEPGSPLRALIEQDLDDDLDRVEAILGAAGSIRAGVLDAYDRAYDLNRITISPDGARIRTTYSGPDGPGDATVPLDQLAFALGALRALLLTETSA